MLVNDGVISIATVDPLSLYNLVSNVPFAKATKDRCLFVASTPELNKKIIACSLKIHSGLNKKETVPFSLPITFVAGKRRRPAFLVTLLAV